MLFYAQRKTREGETWVKKVVSVRGYKLINRVADVNMPPNTGDFRLMSRRVVDEINRFFTHYVRREGDMLRHLAARECQRAPGDSQNA
jgi:hypothetical protein